MADRPRLGARPHVASPGAWPADLVGQRGRAGRGRRRRRAWSSRRSRAGELAELAAGRRPRRPAPACARSARSTTRSRASSGSCCGDRRRPAPRPHRCDARRPLPRPFVAVVAYTLRACLPAEAVGGSCCPAPGAAAVRLAGRAVDDGTPTASLRRRRRERACSGSSCRSTCLVIGDAVLGADVRSGTFPLTWLSPVPLRDDRRRPLAGRLAGRPRHPGAGDGPGRARSPACPRPSGRWRSPPPPGAAAYIALFVLIGVLVAAGGALVAGHRAARRVAAGRRRCPASPSCRPCGRPSRSSPACPRPRRLAGSCATARRAAAGRSRARRCHPGRRLPPGHRRRVADLRPTGGDE